MSIIFQDNEVFEFDDCFILKNELIKNGIDSSGWRLYYKNDISNWIVFYPYSEYHGGGKPYIIRIGDSDYITWINDNLDFEKQFKQMIEKK